MRVMVLGAEGQVGFEVAAVMRMFATVIPMTEADLDITHREALTNELHEVRPDVVINAAAYTNVDKAESDAERAMAVNAEAVATLGEMASKLRFGLIHFSTDFVFDGDKGAPYDEQDEANPISAYGRTKLEGERALEAMGAPALTFRTAWVYSTRCSSFVSTMLRLARTQEKLQVVADQRGNPTFCRDLAEAAALVVRSFRAPFEEIRDTRGIYHLAGEGACSRHELAEAVLSMDPKRDEHIAAEVCAITSEQMPLPARRPADVDLCCSKAAEAFGIRLPPWRASLERALAG